MEDTARPATQSDHDVLIVGAGISGIGMAAHLGMKLPDLTYTILERRDDLGGTWDLFRYPGIRTDSDMHTFGYEFEPWRSENRIVSAQNIKDYLNGVIDKHDIRRRIQYGQHVVSADFRHEDARWHVVVEADGVQRKVTANWLFLGTGYYDYDQAYDAGFDFSNFEGEVLHPQFWPDDLDYAGKNVVVVGSGATAITIVPVMAQQAAKVTMLQRTPTWIRNIPSQDRIARFLRKILPEDLAYKIIRWRNIRLTDFMIKRCETHPQQVAEHLTKRAQESLGDKYREADFTPPYRPWEQRMCFIPDDDLFEAINRGKAEVVTDTIDRFEGREVVLKSGKRVPADIVVTATGLQLAMAGKIALSVEGEQVNFRDHFYYKGCMFSNIPNFSTFFGYTNASWTLRVDVVGNYICRLFAHMKATGAEIATPYLPADHRMEREEFFNLSSNYIKRSLDMLPSNGPVWPWQLGMDYLEDRKVMRATPVVDGVLRFENAHSEERRQAAE
ncbi:NAD(P)/FAD-dependent oxidoreductase [Altererythrobacter arenosus]|uniref:NAD(P)/FAD-dependent oxidoreductase n=1 Tax=Altererythrobacter arenosus TaxID=3032592 RepID=A0ABY8FW85_9SPHN|nr:NAD(P)/FAD-dependent oxidoreductase [Altererythrobacter sp. CAU 1644]WFL78228.1 NAD(P)/FAD-dependent oxidoreductase [Altererythrobacter sp. CAU 1644]